MVQEYQSPVSVYKHPFELIMAAYARRFPTCPLVPVVEDCRVLSESQSEDGSVLVTVRRCAVSVDMPRLLKKMAGVGDLHFLQRNTLNRRERSMHVEVTNESFTGSLAFREVCDYTAHPENEDWTCFRTAATLDFKRFFGLESRVEKFTMKQYTSYLDKGREIIEYYLKEMAEEGITSVPGWSPPPPPPPLASPGTTAMIPLQLSSATSVPSANGPGQEGATSVPSANGRGQEGATSVPSANGPGQEGATSVPSANGPGQEGATSVPSANGPGQEGDCCAHGVTGWQAGQQLPRT